MGSKRNLFTQLYFPGMISLLILPLACFVLFTFEGRFTKQSQLPVSWADEDYFSGSARGKHNRFDIEGFRKYKEITIGSLESGQSENVIATLPRQISDLIVKNDTVKGYKVIFTKQATYGNLVEVLNICFKYCDGRDQVFFVPYENKIYIGKTSRKIREDVSLVDLDNDMVYYKPKRSFEQRVSTSTLAFKNALLETSESFRSFWPCLIILLLMAFFQLKNIDIFQFNPPLPPYLTAKPYSRYPGFRAGNE